MQDSMGIATKNKKANRLIKEKSPYLQQHAYNPVNWYPWGEDALAAAKKQNRPIFLSIGYSTCHWCHVMEHESFENPDIAEVMNQYFVNIKVDREERPDLDSIYMDAVQMLTGGGGWPMSVWLTPDLKPFYGGTYFPPEDRYGRPGFKSLLIHIGETWKKSQDKVLEQSEQVTEALMSSAKDAYVAEQGLPPPDAVFEKAFQMLSNMYDSKHGGFGAKPKFPMPVYFEFLLNFYGRTRNEKALEMVRFTMTKMLKGGIYDQLGGGFARYSTDEFWVVPHFEKMLYDNGQLISILAQLYQATRDPVFSKAAHESIGYIFRDMKHPKGAFYSAEDADSEGKEGTFYLWTLEEIKKTLGDDIAEPFITRYGVSAEGNFQDPHTGESGKNILVEAHSTQETAKKFKKSVKDIETKIAVAEKRLFDIRAKRPRPHLDDKILTGWNGLMITALAQAGSILNEPRYIEAASSAAHFIFDHLYDAKSKTLYRRWREGERKVEAHQIDYALFIQALIDLFEATGEWTWVSWAEKLHKKHNDLFFDDNKGGYFMTTPRNDLLIRKKDERDNVIPSGNSVAALNGFRLGDLTNNKSMKEKAKQTLMAFSLILDRYPISLAKMLTAYDFEANGHIQVILVGEHGKADTINLLNQIHQSFLPNKLLIRLDQEGTRAALSKYNPLVNNMGKINEKATAYVCENFACKRPTNDPQVLRDQLQELSGQFKKSP